MRNYDWFINPPIEEQQKAAYRLNIGCGNYPMPCWTNIDEMESVRADLHVHVPPIPFPDESMQEIYAGHFLEHLDHEEQVAFLAECMRVLRPGGKLGIVVPDMREVFRRYIEGTIDHMEYPLGQYHPIADLDALCYIFIYGGIDKDMHHKWCFEEKTLARTLYRAGFRDLKSIDRFQDYRLANGAWHQCGIEGIKPESK